MAENIVRDRENLDHDLFVIGKDWACTVTVKDKNKDPFDFFAWTEPTITVYQDRDVKNSPIITSFSGSDVELFNGAVKFIKARANTMDFEPGVYWYNFDVYNPDGEWKTLGEGTFPINL